MNLADVLQALFILAMVQLGLQAGFLRQLCMTIGLMAGCSAAALLQTQIASLSQVPATELFLWLTFAGAILIIILFVDIGWSIGKQLEQLLRHARALVTSDKVAGGVLAGVTAIVGIWLCGPLFTRNPNPVIAGQFTNSFIAGTIRQTFPPAPATFIKAANLLSPNSLPQVFAGGEPQLTTPQTSADITRELKMAAEQAAMSVVKVTSRGCGGISTSTGFVASDHTVVTNAHAVAGGEELAVIDVAGKHQATTLLFNPDLDLAVLHVQGLAGKPLPLHPATLRPGQPGATLGYATGSLTASKATVLAQFQAIGYDIYNQHHTSRMVYAINGTIESGDSGGPMINQQGEVTGVVFAKSSSKQAVGYALTTAEVAKDVHTALTRNQVTSNGACSVN